MSAQSACLCGLYATVCRPPLILGMASLHRSDREQSNPSQMRQETAVRYQPCYSLGERKSVPTTFEPQAPPAGWSVAARLSAKKPFSNTLSFQSWSPHVADRKDPPILKQILLVSSRNSSSPKWFCLFTRASPARGPSGSLL